MSLFSRKKPAEELPVARIEVIDLKDGDIVLLHSDHPLPIAKMREIREAIVNELPAAVKLLILDRGLELEVIRPEERERARGLAREDAMGILDP